jgi:hypothetical protein
VPVHAQVARGLLPVFATIRPLRRCDMGKYFLAWLLGVPAGLLILIYLFTHLF